MRANGGPRPVLATSIVLGAPASSRLVGKAHRREPARSRRSQHGGSRLEAGAPSMRCCQRVVCAGRGRRGATQTHCESAGHRLRPMKCTEEVLAERFANELPGLERLLDDGGVVLLLDGVLRCGWRAREEAGGALPGRSGAGAGATGQRMNRTEQRPASAMESSSW